MRLTGADAHHLEFRAPARAGSLAFIGVAMCLLGLLSLLAPTAPTFTHMATTAVLLLFGVGLVRIASRPRRRATIHLETRALEISGGPVPLDAEPRLRLTGHIGDVERLKPAYCVDLVQGGESWQLLEDPDPAHVLEDVRGVLARFPIPVEAGWGLPSWAVAARGDDDAAGVTVSPARSSGELFGDGYGYNHRAAGWTVAGTGTVIGLMMARSVITRVSEGQPANAVSYALPVIVVLAILVMAAVILTSRASLRVIGGQLVWQRSVLGIPLRRVPIPADGLRFMMPVGPVPGHSLHVLLDRGDTLLSLPCPAGDAEARSREIEASLRGTVPGARREAP
jgi:hypothetical protein